MATWIWPQGGHFNQYLATFEPMVTIEFQGRDFIWWQGQEIQYVSHSVKILKNESKTNNFLKL